MARAMWKRKNPPGQTVPKTNNLTVSPITSAIEESLNNLPDDIREECIMAIKNKRNNQSYRNNSNQVNYNANSNNSNHSANNSGQQTKKQKTNLNYMRIKNLQ